jgi:hypothetical protein
MATVAADFRAALDAAVVEIEAENWPAAKKKIVIAEVEFMKLPTEQRSGADSIRYRERLDSMLKTIDSLEASTRRTGDNRRLITTEMGF